MAIQMARDVYTRRQEGTSVWVVRSDQIVASDPADKDNVLRPDGRQGLPPPDLLQAARFRRPHVSLTMQASIAIESTPAVQYLLRLGDTCLILGQRIAE